MLVEALEDVPVRQALEEAGFRAGDARAEGNADQLVWRWGHPDGALVLTAWPDWLSGWHLVGTRVGSAVWSWDEQRLPEVQARGRTLEQLLKCWRRALGQDNQTVPVNLVLGEVHATHQRTLQKVNPGLPHLSVDGPVFRQCRRWLKERLGAQTEAVLELTFDGELLHLRAGPEHLACPATGVWVDPVWLDLTEFLQLSGHALRGLSVRIGWEAGGIWVNRGWFLRAPPKA